MNDSPSAADFITALVRSTGAHDGFAAMRIKATDVIDPVAVKRVVNNLGYDRHLKLETTKGTWTGRIVRIHEDGLHFAAGRHEIDVAFTDVRAVKRTMSRGTKAQMVLWSAIGAFVIYAVTRRSA